MPQGTVLSHAPLWLLQLQGAGGNSRLVVEHPDTFGEERPRVAVALASWNGARYIRQQILSALWQDDCSVTVFVRDDCSDDGTRATIDQLASEYPGRVVPVDDGHGASGSAAQNFFLLLIWLRNQEFDWLALADQDDIWEGRKLARAIETMSREGTDGYSSNLVAFACDGAPPMLIRKNEAERSFDYLFQTASAGCTYVLSARLAAIVAEKLADNRPNPDLAHDIVLYAIARSHGFSWSHDYQARILYRQHGENLVGSRAGLAGIEARLRLIRSGWRAA